MFFVFKDHEQIVALLIENKAMLDIADKLNTTALHVAASGNFVK